MPKPVVEKPDISGPLEWIDKAIGGDLVPLMENLFIIRDERGEYIQFVRNSIQKHFANARSLRDIVVKPRKVGFTTDWLQENLARVITTEGYQALATTYDEDEAEYMFGIVRRTYDNLPEHLRPSLGKDTGRAMSFPSLDSGIEIQTAGGKKKGRGRTPSSVLIDEFGLYDDTQADEILTSLLGSVPAFVPLRIQSTPKGIGNPFHRRFVDALQGQDVFKAHFYPWMWMPEKHRLTDDAMVLQETEYGASLLQPLEFTDEEINLLDGWNSQHPDLAIEEENIRWRRLTQMSFKETAAQEFPEDPVSCFLATTDTVFDTKRLAGLLQLVREPVEVRF